MIAGPPILLVYGLRNSIDAAWIRCRRPFSPCLVHQVGVDVADPSLIGAASWFWEHPRELGVGMGSKEAGFEDGAVNKLLEKTY